MGIEPGKRGDRSPVAGLADARFRAIGALGAPEIAAVRALLGDHPLFSLYLETALAEAGQGNRHVLLKADGTGLVLSITFDALTVRTTVGRLGTAHLAAAARIDGPGELHVDPRHRDAVVAVLGRRVAAENRLRYYQRPVRTEDGAEDRAWSPPADIALVPLGPQALDDVVAFYSRHYPQTIFSAWMLEAPFVGAFEDGELVAAGGVVARDPSGRAVNIGNFLTRPDRRGRGLGRLVVRALLARLAIDGVSLATLGTTVENVPAWRCYEACGFTLLEERIEIVVTA